MKETIILSRLLDKYENSKHLFSPGASDRRVMLRVAVGNRDFPEYDYQDAAVRDAYNEVAIALEGEGLVKNEWVKGRPVLKCVSLNLDRVMECYRRIGRMHPKELADSVAAATLERLSAVSTGWIAAWRDAVCAEAQQKFRVPSYCKNNLQLLEDLLIAMQMYDALHGDSITMRAFSSRCYHDTKYFERNVRDHFLRIAQTYHKGLAQACEQGVLGVRDQLAYLGIYARPELYELAGNGMIHTASGAINLRAAGPYGLALPSSMVDCIASIDLDGIRRLTFIENKTNYDEYCLSELRTGELAVYHGGFLSPQKKKLILMIGAALHPDCEVLFWADIDLGGFQMYAQLQKLLPEVMPLRMSGQDVMEHRKNGLVRSAGYLERVQSALQNREHPRFQDALEKILAYGVTIEQEVFLSAK